MKIQLKSLELSNFKGIKKLLIMFGVVTAIFGANGTGKSTIMDSFMWLLFGKDSKDRKDYKIKTIGADGEELHGLEHSVTAVLEVDGEEIKLQRTYKEKWTKTKGQAHQELKGHTTDYFINDVPASMKEYNEKVNNILADSTFKLISNPLYFTSLDWKKQREILLQIIGDIDSTRVINYNSALSPLAKLLGNGDIDTLRKQVKAKISKIKEQIKAIPNRIDECNLQIVNEDFEALEFRRRNLTGGINSLDEQIADKSKGNEEKLKLQEHLYNLKNEWNTKMCYARAAADGPLVKLKNEYGQLEREVNDIEYNLNFTDREIGRYKNNIVQLENTLKTNSEEQKALREKYFSEQAEQFEFDETLNCCPTCAREYEEEQLSEIKGNAENHFEEFKKRKLSEIQKQGKTLGNIINSIEEKIKEDKSIVEAKTVEFESNKAKLIPIREKLKELEIKMNNFNLGEVTFEGKEQLELEMKATEQDINNFKTDNNLELKAKKQTLLQDLRELDKLLAKKDNNKLLAERIKELLEEEKELAIQQADLEGQDFLCEEFIRTKVELLEGSINQKFNGVSFKLFNKLINGGLEECCEALIDGVPFSAANTASQINSGLEIINTLCNHYNVTAPVFIDNAESVNNITHTESQLIKLVVSLDEKLKVEVI